MMVSKVAQMPRPRLTEAAPVPLHLASLLPRIEAHASTANAEVCGFIYKDCYIPIPNVSDRQDRYYADPRVLAKVLSKHGEPEIIFHTHPNGNLQLSQEDQRLWYYINSTMMVGCMAGGHLRWKMYGKRSD
jgi:proteasome lid subunit RPN8/RPN11